MMLSYLWAGMVFGAVLAGALQGHGAAVSAAAMEGANAGISLVFSMAGALCLWSGLAKIMEKCGIMKALSGIFRPVLGRIFPHTGTDKEAFGYLCGNFTANLLGLGNAATPLGISAVKKMKEQSQSPVATDEMCRLIVLNTASIQLIPTTVAAVRASLGAAHPFDILPSVWVTSLLSASGGVMAAWIMGKCHA